MHQIYHVGWHCTGRLSIAVMCIKQAFNYIKRLESLKKQQPGNISRKCMYRTRKSLTALVETSARAARATWHESVSGRYQSIEQHRKFKRLWTSAMPLNFYNIVKSETSFLLYLKINEYERRRALAQLRLIIA